MRIHPWPLGIIIAFIIFCSFMIGFAVFSKSQPVELVSKDYYQQELAYQDDIDAINRTVEEGLIPRLETNGTQLIIRIPGVVQPQEGTIQLYRPDDPKADVHIKFKGTETGIPIHSIKKGRWEVKVKFQLEGKWYQHQQTWVN